MKRSFLAVLTALLLLALPAWATAADYVVLAPESAGRTANRVCFRRLAAEAEGIETAALYSHIGGALLTMAPERAEALRADRPDLTVVPADIRLEAATLGGGTPVQGKAIQTPWHVRWAQDAGLTDGLSAGDWEGVLVAVFDTGLDSHADLEGRILWDRAYNAFTRESGEAAVDDEKGHGTWVAGVIAGAETGLVPSADVIPFKVADRKGELFLEELTDGFDRLVELKERHFDDRRILLNLSFASDTTSYYQTEWAEYFHGIFDRCSDRGILFFAAAGNDNVRIDNSGAYVYPPSLSDRVFVSVAATDSAGLRASFSNYGPAFVEVGAPGESITTTDFNGGDYTTVDGTSFACPVATAVAAAAWARFPDLEVWQVRNLLINAVEDPRWLAENPSGGGPLPIIAGDAMRPARVTDSAFAAEARGDTPRAIDIAPEDGGGGCSVSSIPAAQLLLLLPLLLSVRRRR
ncbi:MAG: S8 family serine peptidase [Synergistales bacterium]|nr:S8 family serine peptidase [Synergistales bacterium]